MTNPNMRSARNKAAILPRNGTAPYPLFAVCASLLALLAACTFDYGEQNSTDTDQPDIVMENVEYVRIRSGDPVARFRAERAERYEKRHVMQLKRFAFEQFGSHGEETNALGRVGGATVEIDTNNISMYDGVRIDVDSEDLAIETDRLEWKDKERFLLGGAGGEVHIFQKSGTHFIGVGFQADTRKRTWEFTGGVSGSYIYDEEDEDGGGTSGAEKADE